MFDSNHYIPILKWKRAEQGALKALLEENKEYITPLIQFVMPKYESSEQLENAVKMENAVKKFEEKYLSDIPGKIVDVWGNSPIFIDVSLLFTTELKTKSITLISEKGYKLGGIFIPVTHIRDDQEIKKTAFSVAKDYGSGLCLRIICSDLTNMDELNRIITSLVSESGLKEKDIDLLVDIKEAEENADKYSKYLDLSQQISNLSKWRTFTFAAGAFPKDLSECKLDEENLIPRVDWQSWRRYANPNSLQRKPAFADYTIQHPIYKEVTQFFHPTTSIKYTLKENWLIMKGQKQKFDKYLASAALLVKDKRFYGKKFSYGDSYISEKADHFEAYIKNPSIKGTGSTETWLRAGINHHLSLVANQISNLRER